ncbi:carbohydrate esterase family 5 protein [Aspergillus cavernicola]|uniref:Carbohydrate esterase family 5 protein n=1 Tax=Aspergillus cavernicola TaxID=176166 RepID=A0ABR4IHI9_9EURO
MHLAMILSSMLFNSHLATATGIQHSDTRLVNSTDCSNVHLLIARGTTEPYSGSLVALAESIAANNKYTTYEDLIYPATDETSTDSYHVGKNAARKQLTSFAKRCGHTDSKLVKYPRPEFQVEHLTKYYGHVIHDFCNVGYPVCASGSNLTAHLVYTDVWDTTAARWVQSVLDKA